MALFLTLLFAVVFRVFEVLSAMEEMGVMTARMFAEICPLGSMIEGFVFRVSEILAAM